MDHNEKEQCNTIDDAVTLEKWMRIALDEAYMALSEGEVPVGAVIVYENQVIARAHNQCIGMGAATKHAEILALEKASAYLHDWRLSDCTLYVTMEPCPMCSGACVNSRLSKIVFGVKDAQCGACGSVVNLNRYPIYHKPIILSGILQDECKKVLQSFFQDKRKERGMK